MPIRVMNLPTKQIKVCARLNHLVRGARCNKKNYSFNVPAR